MILSPLDALKTTMQTEGDRAFPLLRARIRNHGIGTLVRLYWCCSVSCTDCCRRTVGWRIRYGRCQLRWLLSLVCDVQLVVARAPSFPQFTPTARATSIHVSPPSVMRSGQRLTTLRSQWFRRVSRIRHGFELASSAQDLSTSQREKCVVSHSRAGGNQGVGNRRIVRTRIGNEDFGKWIAGTDVFGTVEAVSRAVGVDVDGIDIIAVSRLEIEADELAAITGYLPRASRASPGEPVSSPRPLAARASSSLAAETSCHVELRNFHYFKSPISHSSSLLGASSFLSQPM